MKNSKVKTETYVDEEKIMPITGTVNCRYLNVRNLPVPDSDVIGILEQNATVDIILDCSTKNFYKVSCKTDDKNINGYCARDFITI